MTDRPILLATDGSPSCEAATAEAIRLAALEKAPLVALCTAPSAADLHVHRGAPDDRRNLEQALHARVAAVLAAVETRAAAATVVCETITALGDPVEQICVVAGARRARLVVLGTHSRGHVGRLLNRSVSELVQRRCACPVLVVRSAATA